MTARFDVLAIDCRDPRRLAEFWCAVLGYRVVEDTEGGVSIAHPEPWADDTPRPGHVVPAIDFLPVPEDKTVKNRLHLDLRPVGTTQDSELARLLGLGARRTEVGQADEVSWVVLLDPEGNEFCLLRTAAPLPEPVAAP